MTAADQIAEISRKSATEHHIRCHDCGQFIPRDRWVRKDHPSYAHALCRKCFSNYDDPAFL